MKETENKDVFDLGSSPITEDFDPFAMESEFEEDIEVTTPEQTKAEKTEQHLQSLLHMGRTAWLLQILWLPPVSSF